MRKSFCALSIAVMVMHLFVLTGTACADDINERFEALYQRYDPNNDPDRINPSPLDGRISEGDSGRDAIISRKNAEEIRRTREASGRPDDPQTAPAPQTQQTTRRWQTGLQEWYSDEAKYQLTNWTFSKDKVTVELIDRRGKVIEKYTIRPYDPGHHEHGFQFGKRVKARTQIVVPEGCQVHGNPAHVNSSSNPAIFNEEETMYFESTDDGPGFTIFPYHAGRWRREIGL